jgi:S-adenosylmethionine uptake transporter
MSDDALSSALPRLGAAPGWGAAAMVGAGLAFAVINVGTQGLTTKLGAPATVVAFWQYGLAALAFLPWLVRRGIGVLATRHLGRHILRVLAATIGVQLFIASLAHVPIWQAVAIDMTSPFLVVVGAGLFLREQTGPLRVVATLVAFAGATLILAPWSEGFSAYALLPLGAAAAWAASSLMTKDLTRVENSETVTAWLLILLTPINAGFLVADGAARAVALLPGEPGAWALIAGLALLTALAQWLLTVAYAKADAGFLQPFDYVRLPVNVLAGLLVFGYAPGGLLWLGAALIVAASAALWWSERRRAQRA